MLAKRSHQTGVALVTALLVTAIATVTAVSMAARQQLDLRRTANVLDTDQAYLFALGVESWAQQILIRDRKDSDIDHLKEDWATILPPIAVEGALLSGSIEDLQGRFNLNNLIQNGAASEKDIQQFKRLLQALGLDTRIALAIVDWMDTDEELSFPDGAEDNEYLGGIPPYRTPNRPMASPSELLRVQGVDRKTYETLAPHVTALPMRTTINVNTATAPVLMSLLEGMSQSEAEQLIEARGDEGYKNIDAFMNQDVLKEKKENIGGISVASNFFMVSANVRLERAQTRLFSLLSRNSDASAQVVMRAQGAY